MSETEQGTSRPVIAPAVAAAIRDILAALEASGAVERPPAVDGGGPVGHGTIRLRGRPDGPASAVGAGSVEPITATEPVGNGRIRLHGRPLESPPAARGTVDPVADILAAFAANT